MLDSYFKISQRGSTVAQEIRGGVVTFFTMAYIVALNPLIIGLAKDGDGKFLGGGDAPNLALIAAATALVAGVFPYFVRESSWWNKALAVGVASAVGEILFPISQAMVGLGGWVQWHVLVVALVVGVMNIFLAPLLLPVTRWTLKETLVG